MRFFAAMAVVVFHLIVDHDGDGAGRFGLPNNQAPIGACAVSFFFVLSGFILTYVYKNQLTYGRVRKFYFKRWARIWPLHLVCLIASIYVIGMVLRKTDYVMMAANLALLQSWVPDSRWVFSFNGVSWSISCEMFFYFMFPFFLIGGQKKFWIKYALLWVFVIGAVIGMQSLANLAPTESPPSKTTVFSILDMSTWDFDRVAHFNPFLRLPEFCTGMGVGFLFFNRAENRKQRGYVFDTVVEILALSLMPLFSVVYQYFHVTWVVRNAEWGGDAIALWIQVVSMMFVFAAIIYVFSRSQGFFAKFLGSRPLVFLGDISFALYMIHFIVIVRMDQVDWPASIYSPWILGACAIGISISLSAFLYKLVEMPAKSGLMSLYAGNYSKSFLAYPTELFQFLKSPTCWGYALVLGLSFGALKISLTPLTTDSKILEVVAASHAPYKNVNFGDKIRLLGAKATPTEKGIELKLVWQKKGPLNRLRFLHFCDDEGNILTQLPPEKKLFKEAILFRPVLESFLLPNAKLADQKITQVGIGFFSKEIDPATNKPYGMLKVSKGLRGMSNFRLYVIGQNELKNLRIRLAKLAGEEAPKATVPDSNAAAVSEIPAETSASH